MNFPHFLFILNSHFKLSLPLFLCLFFKVWLLGNLARATYVGSSDWMWPFSYDTCNPDKVHEQEVNGCRKVGHYGMEPGVGRGAPEIDILEAMMGDKGKLPNTPIQRPYFSSSFQVRNLTCSQRFFFLHLLPCRLMYSFICSLRDMKDLMTLFILFFISLPFKVAPGIEKKRPILMHQPKPVSTRRV